jgi:4-hydroxy-3-methylbut-2-enyl diphosphate reductase IspH
LLLRADESTRISRQQQSRFFFGLVKQAADRFPEIQGPKKDDICYATQNRQDAVKALTEVCDLVIVVGSPNSFTTARDSFIGDKLRLVGRLSAPSVLLSGL